MAPVLLTVSGLLVLLGSVVALWRDWRDAIRWWFLGGAAAPYSVARAFVAAVVGIGLLYWGAELAHRRKQSS